MSHRCSSSDSPNTGAWSTAGRCPAGRRKVGEPDAEEVLMVQGRGGRLLGGDRGVHWTRRPLDAIAVGAGAAVLLLGLVVVRDGSVSDAEERLFRLVNDLPDAVYWILGPTQQLGALVAGPLVAVVALALRRFRLALSACLVTVAKLVLERLVKATVTRERPGTSLGPDINVRGQVSLVGESFVSGHAAMATALAWIIAPYLPARWRLVPWVILSLVLVARVYVGAHNPLDVVCGAGLGLVIAGSVNLLVKVPGPPVR